MNYIIQKRVIDIFVAFWGLVILMPLLLLIFFLVRAFMGGPALFVQERPGFNGKPFKMVKFRTMSSARSEDGQLLEDSMRLTRFGRFLRATSLDELPELWNVLIGDMSLVGPRPLLMEYLPLYNDVEFRRHEVKPGITGWAQVNGRNAISWEHRFKLDVWYVDNLSLMLDIKVLWMTVVKVLKRSDINSQSHVTMEKFRGHE